VRRSTSFNVDDESAAQHAGKPLATDRQAAIALSVRCIVEQLTARLRTRSDQNQNDIYVGSVLLPGHPQRARAYVRVFPAPDRGQLVYNEVIGALPSSAMRIALTVRFSLRVPHVAFAQEHANCDCGRPRVQLRSRSCIRRRRAVTTKLNKLRADSARGGPRGAAE
jgi:hypothetical protein